jgi:hypothetical protein
MRILVFAAAFLAASTAGVASAQWFDECWAEIAHQPVSYFVCPAGDGGWLSAAFAEGGATVNGTITLHMLDLLDDPIPYYPAEDIWLESSHDDLVFPVGGTIPDRDTDTNGITVWQLPLGAGGTWTPGSTLHVVIAGVSPVQPALQVRHNSPDINGDLEASLADLTAFATDYFGVYAYRSDYNWDGAINLADVSALAAHYGHVALRRWPSAHRRASSIP